MIWFWIDCILNKVWLNCDKNSHMTIYFGLIVLYYLNVWQCHGDQHNIVEVEINMIFNSSWKDQ